MMAMKILQHRKVQDIIHVEQFYQVSVLLLTIAMYAFAEHQVIFNVQQPYDTYIDRERSWTRYINSGHIVMGIENFLSLSSVPIVWIFLIWHSSRQRSDVSQRPSKDPHVSILLPISHSDKSLMYRLPATRPFWQNCVRGNKTQSVSIWKLFNLRMLSHKKLEKSIWKLCGFVNTYNNRHISFACTQRLQHIP